MKATSLPRPRESAIQREALAYLASQGIRAFRRNVVAVKAEYKGKRRIIRAGSPGQSDIWGIFATDDGTGRHFEAECKRPGERPTLDQVWWLLRMNAITGAAFWFNSVPMLDKVMRCLMLGGRVEYHAGTQRYGRETGPTSDYDIIWPE